MTAAYRQPAATLIIRQGPGAGQQFTVTEPAAIIGRHSSCDIQVDDPEVSRQHARITWSETGYVVEDLGSANGTLVNGERTSGPHALKDGDLLRLGQVELVFRAALPISTDEMPTMAAAVAPPTMAAIVVPPTAAVAAPPDDKPVEPPRGEPVEPPARVPPPAPAPAEKKGFPWMIVGIVALVLLCLCIVLAAGGYWFSQRGQQASGTPAGPGALLQPTVATGKTSPMPPGATPQPTVATGETSPVPSGATPQPPATPEAVSAPPPPGDILWPIDAATKAHLRQVMQNGQAGGMRSNVFAKIGDSITESMAFLNDYCCGWYDLGPYKELEAIIQYFAATHVDELAAQTNPYHTSFDRMSLVAESGAQVGTMLEGEAEPRLMQEINAIKPGLAIVMFGTNEALAGEEVATYKTNLKNMVAILEKEGVIPILSTIPDLVPPAEGGERIPAFNQAVKEVALEEQVPLMDYWQVLQPLQNKGLDTDGIHPNVFMEGDEYRSSYLTPEGLKYGFNVRNKLALEMLAKVKAIVIDDGPPDGAAGAVAQKPTTAPPPATVAPTELPALPPPTIAFTEPTAQPPPPPPGPQPGASFRRIIFQHHSCGENLIAQGGLRQRLTALGYEFYDHGYNEDGLRLADGSSAGMNFDVPDDNTDPDGYNAIFSQPVHDPPDNTFSYLMQYDVIAFKSCFPVSDIQSDEQLEQYKTYYQNIRAVMDQHPNKVFIVVTQPPLHPSATSPEVAARARAFATWLASPEYLNGHPNVSTFNFFNLLADPATNTLRADYQPDESDSHPNERANQTIAPLFADFIDQTIKNYAGKR